MDKDKEKKPSNDFGPIEVIIGFFLLFLFFTFLFQTINTKLKGSGESSILGDIKTIVRDAKDIFNTGDKSSEKFSIGKSVQNLQSSILFDSPGGSPIRGIGIGEKGVVTDGPAAYQGGEWWEVTYEDGSSGWILGNSLSGGAEEEVQDQKGPILSTYGTIRTVSTWICLVLLVGILYSLIRLFQIRRAQTAKLLENATFFEETESFSSKEGVNQPEGRPGSLKWEVIEKHLNSASESDWRLAILEADILLDEIVRSKGWSGENLGERLKGIDRSDFRTLDKAWEAHKMRNTIAHEGVNFPLSEREARRIVGLFEDVFREFNYI